MKKELTIEHLAAYLPYGLQTECGHHLVGLYTHPVEAYADHDHRTLLLSETKGGRVQWEAHTHMVRFYLRPLSQLTETINHNGERFVPLDWIHQNTPIKAALSTDAKGNIRLFCDNIQSSHYNAWPHSLVRTLLHMHFDVYNLIEAGLAEPIPSINQP